MPYLFAFSVAVQISYNIADFTSTKTTSEPSQSNEMKYILITGLVVLLIGFIVAVAAGVYRLRPRPRRTKGEITTTRRSRSSELTPSSASTESTTKESAVKESKYKM
uniref:Transmembrane protein n=1 Tax=Panagrellus redivivus TaxID=6233 RepID=A0A7E4ZRG1_PANRE